MVFCNCLFPHALWFKKIRTSTAWLFVISIFINIGMWLERFTIVVTSLAHEYLPFAWGTYRPTWVEIGITVGSFAWFFTWFLLFVKFLPSVAIVEIKEQLAPPLREQVAVLNLAKSSKLEAQSSKLKADSSLL